MAVAISRAMSVPMTVIELQWSWSRMAAISPRISGVLQTSRVSGQPWPKLVPVSYETPRCVRPRFAPSAASGPGALAQAAGARNPPVVASRPSAAASLTNLARSSLRVHVWSFTVMCLTVCPGPSGRIGREAGLGLRLQDERGRTSPAS